MDYHILTKTAKWYYEDNLNQEAIAIRLGTSRSTVSRLLNRAREEGIVKIFVSDTRYANTLTLETKVEQMFSLHEVSVVSTFADEYSTIAEVGRSAATVLSRSVDRHTVIGLGWGRSIAAMVNAVTVQSQPKAKEIVALTGGVSHMDAGLHSSTLVTRLGQAFRAQSTTLDAPIMASSAETKAVICREPQIAKALDRAHYCDVAVVGIGPASEESTLFKLNYISDQDLADLQANGVVGEICSRFFGQNGQIFSDVDQRTIGIDLETLMRIPRVIALCSGQYKVKALLGALRLGLIHVLVTDELTAQHLLEAAS